MTHIFAWGNNAKRATMKGRRCTIVASGRLNSVLIRFADNGQMEVVSRRSVRKIVGHSPKTDLAKRTHS